MGFSRVLVANRGEVAIRVLGAARGLGLETVAVFSDADRDAPHVREADMAIRLGPAAALESYLSVDAVMAAVEVSGADALHPGYGFLAEHALLARRCEEASVVFVGPSAAVIDQMGRKDEARRVAAALGIPLAPAAEHDDLAQLEHRARAEIEPPWLVKAVAGGGGKAMKAVRDPNELRGALESARREAIAAFGDGALFVERLLEGARHVEVQVLADHHGAVVHLFERDCTLQRRHQKVVEEAPATAVGLSILERLRTYATDLAREIGYTNAGTVEFLVSGDDVCFLEMNTRLQVEHRVTELVCGVDLVELQFEIAQGRPLPFEQGGVVASGHAIEARVYAEDAAAGFLPQSGRAGIVRWPDGVVVDEALADGQRVSAHYDPMLAKVVAHGDIRDVARRRLVAALDETVVTGLTTNVALLRTLVASEAFASAAIDTEWLERHLGELPGVAIEPVLIAAAWFVARGVDELSPFGGRDGWRVAGPAAGALVVLRHGGVAAELRVRDGRLVSLHGHELEVQLVADHAGFVELAIDGVRERFFIASSRASLDVVHHGAAFSFPTGSGPGAGSAVPTSGEVRAPIPGVVAAIAFDTGDRVEIGDVVVTIESMKTELALRAGAAGTLGQVHVSVGEHVALDQLVAEIREAGDQVIAPGSPG